MGGTVLWPSSEPSLSHRMYRVWQYHCVWSFARVTGMITNGRSQLWYGGDWYLEIFFHGKDLHASFDTKEAEGGIYWLIRLVVRLVLPDPRHFRF